MRNYILIVLKYSVLALFAYCCLIIFYYFHQRSLIYFPNQTKPAIEIMHELGMIDVYLKSDNLKLLSWYKAAKAGRPTIIYFQGNQGNIADRKTIILPYLKKGFGVLLVGYRGYGSNEGYPTEEGLYADARAAYDYIQQQNINSNCIVIYGESLGTGTAIQLASEKPIAGLILQSPFTSLTEVGKYHYPFLPVNILLADRYLNISKIRKVRVPLLFLLASDDEVIPSENAKKLFDAANTKKTLKIYPDAKHNNLAQVIYPEAINFILQEAKCSA